MSDKKRHALVTGASRGIGEAIAIDLAKEGHNISVNFNSHQKDADKVVKKIKELGSDAHAVKGNVSDKESVKEMISAAEKKFGPIEILVNNAGVNPNHGWKVCLDVMIYGVMMGSFMARDKMGKTKVFLKLLFCRITDCQYNNS